MPIFLPEKCLRNKSCCRPLANVEADDGVSFICVGNNDGSTRKLPQDKFTLCWKNAEIDECSDWDKRDLTDTASVICQALSVIENDEILDDGEKYIGA